MKIVFQKSRLLLAILILLSFSCKEEKLEISSLNIDQMYSIVKVDYDRMIAEMKRNQLTFLNQSEVNSLATKFFSFQPVTIQSGSNTRSDIQAAYTFSLEIHNFVQTFQTELSNSSSVSQAINYLNIRASELNGLPNTDDNFIKASVILTAQLVLETYQSDISIFGASDPSFGRLQNDCAIAVGIGTAVGAAAGTIIGGLIGSAFAPGPGTAAGAYAGFKTGALLGAAIGGGIGAFLGYLGEC